MVKIKGINNGLDDIEREEGIVVDTSGSFSIHVSLDKSNSMLSEEDSILVEVFDVNGAHFGYWMRGSLTMENETEVSE